jgi:hypothetical protein
VHGFKGKVVALEYTFSMQCLYSILKSSKPCLMSFNGRKSSCQFDFRLSFGHINS